MKKKILIPTDFSKNAWEAICYALELFRNEDCNFYILNCFQTEGSIFTDLAQSKTNKSRFELKQEESEAGLKRISQRVSFRDETFEDNYHYLSMDSDLLDAMKEIIEKRDIDLVVMGTKGHTDDFNRAFGSNAVRAMEKIRNCPVLVVPPNIIFKEPNEIVFPTSFRTHFKRRELTYLTDLARRTNAPIRVLHVENEVELDAEQLNYKALLEECFEGLEFSFHTLDSGSLDTAVKLFVQSRNSEMIAFINKKHSFFSNIFSQPFVKKIGISSEVPVLAMHDFRN